jgi:hypothetical protein
MTADAANTESVPAPTAGMAISDDSMNTTWRAGMVVTGSMRATVAGLAGGGSLDRPGISIRLRSILIRTLTCPLRRSQGRRKPRRHRSIGITAPIHRVTTLMCRNAGWPGKQCRHPRNNASRRYPHKQSTATAKARKSAAGARSARRWPIKFPELAASTRQDSADVCNNCHLIAPCR